MVVARIVLFLLIVLVCGLARADTPAPPSSWSDIETVVVHAKRRGPVMWRVTKGDSSVVLIGFVGPVPKDLDWNKDGVTEALTGARQLILNAQASVGLFEGLWYLTWHSGDVYLPSGTTVESTLPEPLHRRFLAAVAKSNHEVDHYSSLRPPLALLRLEGDVIEAEGLTGKEPSKSIEKMARHLGVSAKPVANYEALPMLRALPQMSAAANETCVKDALDDLDAIAAHADAAADAWAVGDLETLKANWSEQRFQSCIQAVPGVSVLFQRAVSDSVAAVNAALARPGKTVMLVSFGALLRKDGILDRLRAGNLQIEQT
ncbi:MAG TPA: TraB/GumN family protein [Rhizomicrobium sp.]|nr:TraB/GumN family protein [Rhizomicrobium sp.]